MKRASKKNSALYQYLEPFLETGSDEDITKAKAQYWKEYKKQWKKEKYKDLACFKILLDVAELNLVTKAAKQHKTSRTAYIKQSALTQGKQGNLLDQVTIGQLRELFVLHYNVVETLLEEQEHVAIFTDYLLHLISQLQGRVLNLLNAHNR